LIAHLRGRIVLKEAPHVVIECGGVGYDVRVSIPTYSQLAEIGDETALYIHTHVREDQLSLFGFATAEEKRLFERLIAVSGIGPTLAINVMSGMPPAQLIAALRAGEVARLVKIPGVGKKTAERMVLELRDRLADFVAAQAAQPAARLPVAEDVLSALLNLGYQRAAAEKATDAAVKAEPDGKFDSVFRNALAELNR
jgi:Holliday junction DNA helicase RuvA